MKNYRKQISLRRLTITTLLFGLLNLMLATAWATEPENKELNGSALRNFEKGNKYYDMGPSYYSKALDHYLKAYDDNSENAELNFRIGLTYDGLHQTIEAKVYYEKAIELDFGYEEYAIQSIAQANHIMGNFSLAIKQFETAISYIQKERSSKELQKEVEMLELSIRQCENALRQQIDQKIVVIIE